MFHEAIQAAQSGDRARARDLLTRLLKERQDRVEYWTWMSAVVESPKERKFCLKEALRLDPQNEIARRGLVILGAQLPDESMVVPVQLQKRVWQPVLPGSTQKNAVSLGLSRNQLILMGVGLVALIGLVAFAVWGADQQKKSRKRLTIHLPTFTASAPATGVTETAPVSDRPTPTGSPAPLWMLLESTYTPTPLYVNTPHPASEAYRIGLRAYGKEDWKNASNYFRQAATDVARSDPEAADLLYYIAESDRMEGDLGDAVNGYSSVIRLSPDFAPAYLGRARALLASNPEDTSGPVDDLGMAVRIDPFYVEAYLELAALQIETGDVESALSMLDVHEEILSAAPQAALYRAQALMAEGEYELALESARKAKQLDMTLLPAYRIEGEALQKLGNVKGSLKPLETFLNYEKEDALAWALAANAYYANGQKEEALFALDRAARLDNLQAGVYILRGKVSLEMGDAESALSDFEAALRLSPKSFDASLGIGQALMALNYPGDAWDRFERTQTLAETELQEAELKFWRGQSLERLGELEAAMRDYQSLIQLPGENVEQEWVAYAIKRIEAITALTPTVTPKRPTRTVTPTRTRQPARTPTPTKKP